MATSNNYGAIDSSTQNGESHRDAINERTQLLRKSDDGPSLGERLQQHFTTDVDKHWGDLALLFCYTITGLLDSSSTSIWGAFTSMQTGNTVYLGLGLTKPSESTRWIRSIISILAFCLGSLFFSRYHRNLGARKRWVMVSSYTIQLSFIITAALLVTLGPEADAESRIDAWVAVPLGLLAFQSSGQAVTSRVLNVNSLTSVVLTSIYCDLFSDQKLFTAGLREDPARNQRAAAPTMLLIGAIIGGLWLHSPFGMAGALWTAAAFKAILIVLWTFWRAEPKLEN